QEAPDECAAAGMPRCGVFDVLHSSSNFYSGLALSVTFADRPFPSLARHLPRPGEVFPQRESLSPTGKLQASPFGELALRSNDGEGKAVYFLL
ncbi:MAG: hypothetical protein V8R76_02955, partial [Faecalibacterium sp.]